MADQIDTVTLDVPLLTRLLELSRESIKTDADLHNVLTKVIAASKEHDVLTMEQYDELVPLKAEARLMKVTASAIGNMAQTLKKILRQANINIVNITTLPDSALMDVDGDLPVSKWKRCMEGLGFKDQGDHHELPGMDGVGIYYDDGTVKVKPL
jgi:hypothetical protein